MEATSREGAAGAEWPLSLFLREFPEIFKEPDAGVEGDAAGGSESAAEAAPASADAANAAETDGAVEEGEQGPAGEDGLERQRSADPYGYKARLRAIEEEFASAVQEADKMERYLHEKYRAAREAEALEEAENDAKFTPMWRQTGLPMKPSPLDLDPNYMASLQMLDSKALLDRLESHKRRELAPPQTHEFMEPEARLNYLNTTAAFDSYKAAQGPKATKSRLRRTMEATWAAEQAMTGAGPPMRGTGTLFGLTSTTRWADLPPEEVEGKMRVSEQRRREMMAHMDNEQMDREMEVLKRMNQKVEFRRNPRFVEGAQAGLRDAEVLAKGGLPALQRTLVEAGRITRGGAGANSSASASASAAARKHAVVRTRAAMGTSLRHPLASDPGPGVVAEPGHVEFREYHPGGYFEAEVALRNVSGVLRRIRVMPTRTQYFQVQSVEFPDSPTGVIAPGLHCLVRVRFSPDSLADYDDALEVTTDVGPLSVPLLGRRPPPSLTLLRDIDCGAAVVGNWRVMRLPFANLGGDGAFRLVPSGQPSRPPSRPSLDGSSVSLESAGARDQMRVGDFVVWPTSLDVPAGAEAALWVAFRPSRAGKCSAKFRMVCDNCNVRVFALKGTGADVELSVCRVDQRVPLPTEVVSLDPSHAATVLTAASGAPPPRPLPHPHQDLWFDHVTPGHSRVRTFCVINPSPLPVPFQWHIAPLPPASATTAPLPAALATSLPSTTTAFSVRPTAGTLKPKSVAEFTVTFAPTALVESRQLLALFADLSTRGTCGEEATVEHHAATARVGAESGAAEGHGAYRAVLAVGVQGFGAPVDAAVRPGLVCVPGTLTPGQPWSAALSIENRSPADAKWEAEASDAFLTLGDSGGGNASVTASVTASGTVPAGGACALPITVIAPAALGDRSALIRVRVRHGPSLCVPVRFTVAAPRVIASQPGLDFGLVQTHLPASRTLTLRNLSAHTPAVWRISAPSDAVVDPLAARLLAGATLDHARRCLANELSQYSMLSGASGIEGLQNGREGEGWGGVPRVRMGGMAVRPSALSETLPPGGERNVEITCVPCAEGALSASLEVAVEGGDALLVPLSCDSLQPRLRFHASVLEVGDLYVGVPKETELIVSNCTPFPTTFAFDEAHHGDADCVRFSISPPTKRVRANEVIRVRFSLLPLRPGRAVAYFTCRIDGAVDPMAVKVQATVHGLQVSYRLERVPTPATLEAGEGASRVTAALTAALTQDSLTLTRPNRFGNALNSLGMTNTVRGSLASDLLLAEIRRAAEAGFRPDETRRALQALRPPTVIADPSLPKGDYARLGVGNAVAQPQRYRLVATNLSAIPTRVAVAFEEFAAHGSPALDALLRPRAGQGGAGDRGAGAGNAKRQGNGGGEAGAAAGRVGGDRDGHHAHNGEWGGEGEIDRGDRSPSSPGSPRTDGAGTASTSGSPVTRRARARDGSVGGVRPAGASLADVATAQVLAGRAKQRVKERAAHGGAPFRLGGPGGGAPHPTSTATGHTTHHSGSNSNSIAKHVVTSGGVGSTAYRSHTGQRMVAEQGVHMQGRRALSHNKGLAFVFEKQVLDLPPMEEVAFEFTAHCNMPGVYADVLRMRAVGVEDQSIPVQIGFVGSALVMHKHRRHTHGYALEGQDTDVAIHAGDVTRNTQISKQLFVTNVSPFPVRLTWDCRAVIPDALLATSISEYGGIVAQKRLGEEGSGGSVGFGRGAVAKRQLREPGESVIVREPSIGLRPLPSNASKVVVGEDGEGLPPRRESSDRDRVTFLGSPGSDVSESSSEGEGSDSEGSQDSQEAWETWRREREIERSRPRSLIRLDMSPGPTGRIRVSIDPVSIPIDDPNTLAIEPREVVIAPGATHPFHVSCTTSGDLSAGRVFFYGKQEPIWPDAHHAPHATTTHAIDGARHGGGDNADESTAAARDGKHAIATHADANHANGHSLAITHNAHATARTAYGAAPSHTPPAAPLRVHLLPRPFSDNYDLLCVGSYHPWAHRPDLDMGVLRVQLSMTVVEAQLGTDARDGLSLHVHANRAPGDPQFARSLTLTNHTATPLVFVADTRQPFDLLDPVPPRPECFLDQSAFPFPVRRGRKVVHLLPHECLELPVLFREPEEQEAATDDYGVDGELLVTFANREQQVLPLRAQVIHPELTVQPESIKFGAVHVLAPKPARVVLTNPTDADAEWVVVEKGQKPQFRGAAAASQGPTSAQIGAFTVEPCSGVIPGRGLLMPRSQVVSVTLAPKQAAPVAKELVFAVRRGRACRLRASGVGTHDEAEEHQRALKTLA